MGKAKASALTLSKGTEEPKPKEMYDRTHKIKLNSGRFRSEKQRVQLTQETASEPGYVMIYLRFTFSPDTAVIMLLTSKLL